MSKAFELSAETGAFLFQVLEYGGEIGHVEILAAYMWCNAPDQKPHLLKNDYNTNQPKPQSSFKFVSVSLVTEFRSHCLVTRSMNAEFQLR